MEPNQGQMIAEAQYTIWLPQADGEDPEANLEWLLPQVRQTLSKNGLKGRTVIRDASADWDDISSGADLIQVVTEDSPRSDAMIRAIAEGIRTLSRQQAIYVTKQPISSWLITGPGAPQGEPTAFTDLPKQ